MIKKYQSFKESNDISNDFIQRLEVEISNVSESNKWKELWNSIPEDIMTNIKLVGTFGVGITGFFPIISELIQNNKFAISEESIVYITIASVMYIIMEETKNGSIKENIKCIIEKLNKEELEILPKVIESIRYIKSLFVEILSNVGNMVVSMIDMLSYTSYLIPILNVVNYLINKYNFTFDNLSGNIFAITFGIGTGVIKNYLNEIVKKIKS